MVSMKRPIQIFNYSIQNAANDVLELHIDGEIVDASTQAVIEAWFGDTTSTSYRSLRNSLDARSDFRTLNVIINSPGGHVGDALAIHDYLKDLQSKGKTVNTIGRGIVASSATLILLAGENPEMSANSWFMMHQVSGGIYGTVDQVENYGSTMRKFNNKIRDLYASLSGMRTEEVTKLMNAGGGDGTFLTAQEAKDKGLVKKVSGEAEFSNSITKDAWPFANTAILNSYNSFVKPAGDQSLSNIENTMKQLFLDLKNTIINKVGGIQPAEGKPLAAAEIANAVGAAFDGIGERFETEVATQISNALVNHKPVVAFEGEVFNTAVTNAVTTATAGLVKEVGELKAQLEQSIGNKGQAPAGDKSVTPLGGF